MVDIVRTSYPRPLLQGPQPPTPPLETDPDSKKGFSDAIDRPPKAKRFLDTPDGSSSPTADYFSKTSSNKAVKRVDFSPWINYEHPVTTHRNGWQSEQRIRRLPPSRDCRSAKSILKPYPIAVPSNVRSSPTPDHNKPFPEMLEDWCRAFASKSRGSRLDAYNTINNCLKAYKDLPHQNALRDKMPLLCGFIQRDLQAELEPGSMDTQMMIQAMKLLSVFLWTPVLSVMLPDEFCSFVVERSISMLENQNVSKAVVNHFLNILATQNFRRQVMNAEDRAKRILNVLNEVGGRVKGNGVIGQRLIIYKRLLSQARPLMTARVTDWVDPFFTGILSSIKDIRSRGLAFGLDAAISLGTVSSVSNTIMDTLNRTSSDGGKRFIDLVIDRMNAMIASPDDSSHVPQIWSVVILFFRSHRGQLEGWEYLKGWLGIIQKCFNSSDVQVKNQASQAWNRLIFATGLDSTTSLSSVVMLRHPILPQLERKGGERHTKHAKHMAYSTFCTLLYYAFKPGATNTQLDKYWELYIEYFFPAHISANKIETGFACQVLSSLLGESRYKVWDSNRVNEEGFIGPEDLPRLDPKWIRIRAQGILTIFEYLLGSVDWQTTNGQESYILQAWRSFTKALGDAGSKEVKVSMECMRAIAQILSSMKRLLLRSNPQKSLTGEKLLVLVKAAVEDLGPLVFTEKRVTQGSSELFEAAETPSSRSVRPNGTLASPIAHLIETLILSIQPAQPPGTYEQPLKSLIDIALRGGTSKRSQISILYDLISIVDSKRGRVLEATEVLWRLIVASLEVSMRIENHTHGSGSGMEYNGNVCKDIIAIIEVGLRQGFTPSPSWETFLGNVINKVQKENGVAAAAIAILEPLSKALEQATLARYDVSRLQAAEVIIKSVGWPKSRKEVENAQTALHGSMSPSPRPTSANPYHHLFSLINSLLTAVYRNVPLADIDVLRNVFQSLIFAISSCPLSIAAIIIQRIQHGIGVWIEDPDNLRDNIMDAFACLDPIILETWTMVAKKIKILPSVDASYSLSIEYLIRTSLLSRQDIIAKESSLLWIDTFGPVPQSEYPDALRKLLSPARHGEDLNALEGIKETPVKERTYLISTDTSATSSLPPQSPGLVEIEPEISKQKPVGDPKPAYYATNSNTRSTPEPRPLPIGRGSKTTPPARLRHNDSQIEFAAIDSSPYDLEALESQFLTEHQKEVKERQKREAAALFPDLRSSPRVKSRDPAQDLPKLYLSSQKVSQLMEELTSPPSSPPVDLDVNDFLISSPTPRSRRTTLRDQIPLRDLSSSPPIFKLGASIGQVHIELISKQVDSPMPVEQQVPIDTFGEDIEMSISVDSAEENEDQTALPSIEGLNTDADMSDVEDSSDEEDSEAKLPSPYRPQSAQVSGSLKSHLLAAKPILQHLSDENIFSDVDQFMDARSNQNGSSAEPADGLGAVKPVSDVAENLLESAVGTLQTGEQIPSSTDVSKDTEAITVSREKSPERVVNSPEVTQEAEVSIEQSSHSLDGLPEVSIADKEIFVESIEETSSSQPAEASRMIASISPSPENTQINPQFESDLNQAGGATTSGHETRGFPGTGSSRSTSPNPGAQTSARLATEIEVSMSQASEGIISSTPESASKNKRKRESTGPQTIANKRKSPDVKVVVPKRGVPPTVELDEEIYDCIVVAPRPDQTPMSTPSQQSQRRKSGSKLGQSSNSQQPNTTHSIPSQGDVSSKKKTRVSRRPLAKASSHTEDTSVPSRKRRRQSTQEDETAEPSPHLTSSQKANKRTRLSMAGQRGETTPATAATETITISIPKGRQELTSNKQRSTSSPELMGSCSPDETKPVKSQPTESFQAEDERDSDDLQPATGSSQEAATQNSNQDDEAIEEMPATANSIVERLKQILNDAKNVVLGSRERETAMKTWMALGTELHKSGEGDAQEK